MRTLKGTLVVFFIFMLFFTNAVSPQQNFPRRDCCWQIWAAGCNLGWATSLMYYTQSRQRWAGVPDETIARFIETAGLHIVTSNQVCSRLLPAWPEAVNMQNYLRNLAANFRRMPNSFNRQRLHMSLNSTFSNYSRPLMVEVVANRRQMASTCSEKYFKMGWLLSYAQQTLKIADEQLRGRYPNWMSTVFDARNRLNNFVMVLRQYFALRPVTGRCVRIGDFNLINRVNQLLHVQVNPTSLGYMIREVDAMHAQLQQRLPQDCPIGTGGAVTPPADDPGLTDVTVNRSLITVSVWDHSQIDGDRVDVYLNGRLIRHNVLLQRQKTSFNLQIGRGVNTLSIRALNEGSSSPNTASMEISHVIQGKRQQQWKLKTGQTGSLRIHL